MKHLLPILSIVIFSSCLGLDDNLFNPSTDITSYEFDNFEGIQEIESDVSFEENEYALFTLPVGTNNESIYLTYVGDTSTIQFDSVILYCHGNAGHMDYYWPRTKLLASLAGKGRHGVLTLDYRGYGLSEGKPSEENMYEDVATAINWLKQKGLTEDRFFIYGFSLGGAPACELTANPQYLAPNKLMLESTFASAEVMIQDGSGLALPSSFFVDLKIDNAEEIKKISQPLYWIHGTEDDFIDIATHGEVLFKNHQGAYKIAHRIEGANHGDVPFVMGFDEYRKSILDFLTQE
jgi:pimeloyl-ACP methyl ester carboxylesterase